MASYRLKILIPFAVIAIACIMGIIICIAELSSHESFVRDVSLAKTRNALLQADLNEMDSSILMKTCELLLNGSIHQNQQMESSIKTTKLMAISELALLVAILLMGVVMFFNVRRELSKTE
jgi:hypothetical protein